MNYKSNSDYYKIIKIVKEINNKIPIEDFLKKEIKVNLRRSSSKNGKPVFMCSCPFHKDSSPSFAAYTHNNSFYCFSCHKSGDVVKLYQFFYKKNWMQSVQYFCTILGIELEFSEKDIFDFIESSLEKDSIGNIDSILDTSLNFYVTNILKDISRKFFNNKKILSIINKIYYILDKAIDNQDKIYFYLIKNKIIPEFIDYIEKINKNKEELNNLYLKNKVCSSCNFCFRDNNKIITPDSNIVSDYFVITDYCDEEDFNNEKIFSGKKEEIFKKIVSLNGKDYNDFHFDTIIKCKTKINEIINIGNESEICKKQWLYKYIDFIKPKKIIILGENTIRLFYNNNFLEIKNYIENKDFFVLGDKKYEVYYNYHPKELDNEEKKIQFLNCFKKIFGDF